MFTRVECTSAGIILEGAFPVRQSARGLPIRRCGLHQLSGETFGIDLLRPSYAARGVYLTWRKGDAAEMSRPPWPWSCCPTDSYRSLDVRLAARLRKTDGAQIADCAWFSVLTVKALRETREQQPGTPQMPTTAGVFITAASLAVVSDPVMGQYGRASWQDLTKGAAYGQLPCSVSGFQGIANWHASRAQSGHEQRFASFISASCQEL